MKPSKILFITDKYLPFPSSNGSCVSKVSNAFSQKENIYVVAFSSAENEDVVENAYFCSYKRKPSSVLNRVLGYCQDDGAVTALYNTACKVIEENNIDTVVCVYRPVECLLAGLKLKNKYKNLCVKGYFLDNIYEWSTASKIKDRILFINQKKLLHKLNRSFDSNIVLKYYQNTFETMLNKNNKITYVGLPSLKEYNHEEQTLFNKDHINVVYAGSFYPDCRRPDEILDFLQAVCAYLPQVKIYLYSWGCEDMVSIAKEKMGQVLEVCGRVSSSEAERAIHSADILLNVGNDLPYAVPGKLIEYFATGKPIINFCYRRTDGATKDCKKYENVFNVYSNSDNSVDDCVQFVLNRYNLSWEVLKERFYDSLPEYTADIILEARLNNTNV